MFYQLPDPFEVDTPLGYGWAIAVVVRFHESFWVVALETGALVDFTQDKIRICGDYSQKRGITDDMMKRYTARK